ncbi:HNH endonuclease, partial [Streptococcus pyogenes]
DHKDRDKLNCRIDNLRLATRSQNGHNRGVNYNNATEIKGLTTTTQRGYTYYSAKITVNKKQHRKLFKYTEEGKELAIA